MYKVHTISLRTGSYGTAPDIVDGLEDALRRIHDYAFPLEDARAQAAYGVHGGVNELIIITASGSPAASPSSSATRPWGSRQARIEGSRYVRTSARLAA
ncbi:hypothetical protein [Arthrobacter sp. NPDC057013]|uniref:hypothetical protein n=1 Tax=Arthrobacter sp. NPDC057013 TaxID=3345999 RepID=UPI00362E8EED